jgi:hypothetical protein
MENKKLYFFLAEDEEIIEAEFVKITDNIIELKFGNITYFVVKNLVFETKLNAFLFSKYILSCFSPEFSFAFPLW